MYESYTLATFAFDYLIASLPITIVYFLFPYFLLSNKKDDLYKITEFILIENIVITGILAFGNMNDFFEPIAVAIIASVAICIYDKDIRILNALISSIISFLLIFISQALNVFPIHWIFGIDFMEFQTDHRLTVLLQVLMTPLNSLVLFNIYLRKIRRTHEKGI